MRTISRIAFSLGACALWAGHLLATPVITVGNFNLKANTANQQIQIFVTGGDAVQTLDLRAQVGDGGPLVNTGLPGPATGPTITGDDILTGTIFAANNLGATDPGSAPQFSERRTTTNPVSPSFPVDSVPAQGLLTTLTIDTTGFTTVGQVFPLLLKGTLATKDYDTDFGPILPSITNGTITIVAVPEPSMAIAFGLMGAAAMLRRRVRTAV